MIIGGDRPAGASPGYGCYAGPTIIAVDSKHSLWREEWREEVFGPVVATREPRGFDEAVKLANEFIDRAEAGQVPVSLPASGWDVHHPFLGFGDSGSPFKEQGCPGLRCYTRIKTAAVRFAW